jgi:CMP-N,N'-diacetyllegionaminic acid synthase
MLNGRSVVAVVPARGGSKGIPKKSIALLGGRPLLEWAISTARGVARIDQIIVSTDSPEIGRVALNCGADVYTRPAELALDSSLVIDMLRDLLLRLRNEGRWPGYVVLLEATAPFREAEDVNRCLDALGDDSVDSVATFTDAATKPAKAWAIVQGVPSPFLAESDPWAPRQQTPPAWELNGGCYAFAADRLPSKGPNVLFGNSRAVLMPRSRSFDINDEEDLAVAEALVQRRGRR